METLLEDVIQAARGVRQIHMQAEALLLERLARAVSRGLSTEALGRELLERQALLRDLDRLLGDLERRVPGAVAEAHRLAYAAGQGRADTDLPTGYRTGPRPLLAAAPEAVLARAALDPTLMRYQIRRWTADVYDRVTQEAAGMVVTGALTRREASARLLARLVEQGVTGFVDRRGRNWEMGAYAEMAVRASSMNATLQGQSDRLLSYGVDTVYVSDHTEECAMCRPWEGKVLSLTGGSVGQTLAGERVVASLADARAGGLFHPGCRHTTSAFIPGSSKPPKRTADPEGDSLRQEQRARERDIRRRKRRVLAAEAVDGKTGAVARAERARLAAARKDFAEWRRRHDRKNLTYRENIKAR